MAKRRYQPTYAAGVLIRDTEGFILAVSRQAPYKYTKTPHHNYDWGIPAGKGRPGEYPYQTAMRELEEETGITTPGGVIPVLEVPPMTGRLIPLYVFTPQGPTAGHLKRSTPEGAVAWLAPPALLEVKDPGKSVADSNRFILYYAFGIG